MVSPFRRRPSRAAGFLSLVTLGAVLAACAGCGGKEGDASQGHGSGGAEAAPAAGGPPGETVPVAVVEAEIGVASSNYGTTAVLEAENHAQILARTTGVVRRLLREEGDLVQAGEVLIELEDDGAALRVRQAEVQLDKAEALHARAKSMREMGMLSDQEFESQDNDLHLREAELDLARLDLSYTRVVSPFAGRVVRRHVDLGANVTPGTALADVMDVTPLLALVHVPANRMGFVKPGQSVKIRLDSTGTDLDGVVRLVSPIVDPGTGTVKVTVEIMKYPPATRPGDFAQIQIVTARHDDAILVPSRAIFEEQGQSILFVVQEGKAVRRVVKSGFVDGENTEILEGVVAKDLVVVKGQRDLRDGLSVEILEGPAHVLAKKAPADGAGGADTARADAAPTPTS
jgi:membrane fusion protein (multidrug efflux system)